MQVEVQTSDPASGGLVASALAGTLARLGLVVNEMWAVNNVPGSQLTGLQTHPMFGTAPWGFTAIPNDVDDRADPLRQGVHTARCVHILHIWTQWQCLLP